MSVLEGPVDTAYASPLNAEPSSDSVQQFTIRCPGHTAFKEVSLTALDATVVVRVIRSSSLSCSMP